MSTRFSMGVVEGETRMHRGRVRALGTPGQLKAAIGPDATLDDVFRHHTGDTLENRTGGMRDVRAARRTAGRLG